jgi:mevalonate kinase
MQAKAGYASKLTGAGGGGCALTLVPATGVAALDEVKTELSKLGYDSFETTVGGDGVLIGC